MQYSILRLQPKRDKSVINKHPWVFSGAVAGKVVAHDGDIVAVVNADNKVLGYGFYSSGSQIVCRLFHWGESPEDFQTVDFWKQKVVNAYQVRNVFIEPDTNCYRLVYAEGDFLPGLIIDIYNQVAILQLLIPGVEKIKPLLKEALESLGFVNLFVKSKVATLAPGSHSNEEWLAGNGEGHTQVTENGLLFNVNYTTGQKTGFFIDQRDNRLEVKNYCKGRVVLNAFSYTGGFSIYALAGGAREVHSLDISKDATQEADFNVRLNGYSHNHKTITQDCFEYLKEMPDDYYDLIVLDPPAFAKHSRAIENAAKGYKQINLRAMQKIKPGGLIFTYSCSQHISQELFQKIIFGAAVDARREVRIIKNLHQAPDHPVNIFHPEGAYLKGLLILVE